MFHLNDSEDAIRQEACLYPTLNPFRKDTELRGFKKQKEKKRASQHWELPHTTHQGCPGTDFYLRGRSSVPERQSCDSPFQSPSTKPPDRRRGQNWRGHSYVLKSLAPMWYWSYSVSPVTKSHCPTLSLLHASWGWWGRHLPRARMGWFWRPGQNRAPWPGKAVDYMLEGAKSGCSSAQSKEASSSKASQDLEIHIITSNFSQHLELTVKAHDDVTPGWSAWLKNDQGIP